jgi:hypothetical protein
VRAGLLLLLPLSLGAQQTTFMVDVGTSRMRFADTVAATALSVSPSFRVAAPRGFVAASGTFSRLGDASSHSGILDAVLTTGRRGAVRGEIEGIAGGSAHNDGTRTGQLLALARVNIASARQGAWIGGGTGTTWDGSWRTVFQGDVGAWLSGAAGTASLSAAPTIVDDTIRYTDLFVAAYRARASWEFSGSIGARAGNQLPSLPANNKIWGNLGAIFWANPSVGIVASAGTYPVDFTQGYPGGRFATLSVRIRSLTEPVLLPMAAPPPGEAREFRLRRESGGSYRLRVLAPGARTVAVTGDFSGWSPVALTPEEGGWWTAVVPMSAGTHEINVRVNDGPWRVPPGLASMKDEFGGTAGLLIAPM